MNAVCSILSSTNTISNNIKGTITFHQCRPQQPVKVSIILSGFKPHQLHAIHIHEFGDLRQGCESLGPHFNPLNKNHGSIKVHGNERHAGDMINNIMTDENGNVNITYYDPLLSLHDTSIFNIYGRSIVIHEKPDDLGLGGTKESLTTGSAGKRIACGIIGRSQSQSC
jgi:Cu-Zn family superoxide dismutase